ncbi:acyl-CoA synthetase [Fibrella aquatilis]|uniref:Acyl-CoA synthetase n=1 Tax=Fibrella aquatilis TaxID=2817059 RepID=A0A939G192_9BACT|nr:acyl-CoA synthetase [Fibrella aquatilis]MBO0929383.1 acyl-CoA synthetase [Fibrella aquatilis]
MIHAIQQPFPDPQKTAIITGDQVTSYGALQATSTQFARLLLDGQADLAEARVAFMVSPGADYVRVQWGIWLAGGVAVPLCTTYPLASLQYVIEDTEAGIVVVSPEFESLLTAYVQARGLRFIVLGREENVPDNVASGVLPTIDDSRRAMILYTSGTTNLPKGVVTTHAAIDAQVTTLLDAWAYSDADYSLCCLPLHHVHGIINVVSCTLRAGGTVAFLPHFSAAAVFDWFEKTANAGHVGVFMAVPTIYFKLIAYFETLSNDQQMRLTASLNTFRLMVSGSAALPVSVMEKWETISGHRLLERYGMTELGMAISNPYQGERRAGHIGQPLPGVGIRLVNDAGHALVAGDASPGEIQVRGANLFLEYWRKPTATAEAFTADGWFKTGDVAVLEDGYYRMLGRSSIDIIKSGGYKLSALEIEEVLRTHPDIADCSVVGIDNDEWGELVVAALVVSNPQLDTGVLNTWLRERMPAYKVPRRYLIVAELPRNAMGKVTKNDLKKMFQLT